jgi:tRNA pseudouridine38-40 synthase
MRAYRHALKVFYNGKGFAGSQRQLGERTVEGEFIEAIKGLEIDFKHFKTAGRTDKGVSALGNVFALTIDSELVKPRILNSVLPDDIKVLAARRVSDVFNPRHAFERIYRYFLHDEGYDLERMMASAEIFNGKNSFHNFSTTDYRSPIRKINYIDIKKRGDVLVIKISGESFLWQMVRRMVTSLKKVGLGEFSNDDIRRLMEPRVKEKVPPSEGENLVLWDVLYDFGFKSERYSKKRLVRELREKQAGFRIREAMYSELLRGLD